MVYWKSQKVLSPRKAIQVGKEQWQVNLVMRRTMGSMEKRHFICSLIVPADSTYVASCNASIHHYHRALLRARFRGIIGPPEHSSAIAPHPRTSSLP
jgi:hypothetical protein